MHNINKYSGFVRYGFIGLAATALLGAGLILTVPTKAPAQETRNESIQQQEATPAATSLPPIVDYTITPTPKPGLLDVSGVKVVPLIDLSKGPVTFTGGSAVDPKDLTPMPGPTPPYTELPFKPYAIFRVKTGPLDNLLFYAADTGIAGGQAKFTFDRGSATYQRTTDGRQSISASLEFSGNKFTLTRTDAPNPTQSFTQLGLKIDKATIGVSFPDEGYKKFNLGFTQPGETMVSLSHQNQGKTMLIITKFF